MLNVIKILQLGTKNFNEIYTLPDYLENHFVEEFVDVPKKQYDLVFVDRILADDEVKRLYKVTKAYTVYVMDDIELTDEMKQYFVRSKGKYIKREDVQSFLSHEAKYYFGKPYGEKMRLTNFAVAHGFKGSVDWNGYYSINLDGFYGDDFKQILYLRNNLPLAKNSALELWLEYEKDDSVEIELEVNLFQSGSISTAVHKWTFTEAELNELIVLEYEQASGNIFISIRAKGNGKFKLIAMHDRHSRNGHGCFLPGGERTVFSNREEVFHYFDPGDMKPPLNVYFSGYKTAQGFEGYYMMKKMGCPFLLIGEPRLEGGAFYMGSEEYEHGVADIIRRYMDELGFDSEQVVLSGLSMGTFCAMYYGCDILPHAIILGKPLCSIGDVAANERLHRPGGFPTSLDVVNYLSGNIDEKSIDEVNNRFWDKFENTSWKKTKFAVAYMIEDDYDSKAYTNLISHLKGDGVKIYGKGIHGRHNDASGAIVGWFKNQYDSILNEDFKRRH